MTTQPPSDSQSPTTPTPVASHQQTGRLGQLRSLRVQRFKQIDDITLQLDDDPLVLVGSNNSGKSSVLHAAHFAVALAQTSKLVGDNVNWASDRFQLSINPTQLLWCPVADAMSLARGGQLREDIGQGIRVDLTDTAGNTCGVVVRRGRNRNIKVELNGRALGERLQDLTQPFSVYTPGLAGVAREERFLSPGVVLRSVARGDANLVLRNVLQMLKTDPQRWQTFLQNVRVIFPDIQFTITFDESIDEFVSVKLRLDGETEVPLDAVGTAVLQSVQILGYLALYAPPLVLLGEPDSHLHPNNQRALCRLLQELAERDGCSTHHGHSFSPCARRTKGQPVDCVAQSRRACRERRIRHHCTVA